MNNIIDQYGAVDAQIKELELIKSKLKAELLARGIGELTRAKTITIIVKTVKMKK